MLNIGLIIAAGVLVIYAVLGPLVLMGVYTFFDRLAEKAERGGEGGSLRETLPADKDPALWSDKDVRLYLKRKQRLRSNEAMLDEVNASSLSRGRR